MLLKSLFLHDIVFIIRKAFGRIIAGRKEIVEIILLVILVFLTCLIGYIWAMLAGVRFYWRWLIFLPVFGTAWFFCSLNGIFSGNFNSSVTTEYRSRFWKEFILTVRTTPDFSSSVTAMRKKTETPEFTSFKEAILPKYPSSGSVWTAIFFLAAAIGLEFWKKPPWNRIGILVLTLAAVCLWSNHEYEFLFARYSRYHLETTCEDHKMMLDDFAEQSKQIRLSQEKIADAMNDYSKQWQVVCHGEPYSELMSVIAPPAATVPAQSGSKAK